MILHKRACSGIFFLLLLMFMTATVFATENRASERFISYDASQYVVSNGDLDINFSVIAVGRMDILGASKIVVERNNGYRWAAESTLTVQDAPEMQATNSALCMDFL